MHHLFSSMILVIIVFWNAEITWNIVLNNPLDTNILLIQISLKANFTWIVFLTGDWNSSVSRPFGYYSCFRYKLVNYSKSGRLRTERNIFSGTTFNASYFCWKHENWHVELLVWRFFWRIKIIFFSDLKLRS